VQPSEYEAEAPERTDARADLDPGRLPRQRRLAERAGGDQVRLANPDAQVSDAPCEDGRRMGHHDGRDLALAEGEVVRPHGPGLGRGRAHGRGRLCRQRRDDLGRLLGRQRRGADEERRLSRRLPPDVAPDGPGGDEERENREEDALHPAHPGEPIMRVS